MCLRIQFCIHHRVSLLSQTMSKSLYPNRQLPFFIYVHAKTETICYFGRYILFFVSFHCFHCTFVMSHNIEFYFLSVTCTTPRDDQFGTSDPPEKKNKISFFCVNPWNWTLEPLSYGLGPWLIRINNATAPSRPDKLCFSFFTQILTI